MSTQAQNVFVPQTLADALHEAAARGSAELQKMQGNLSEVRALPVAGYESLARILDEALKQAQSGKGAERHGNGKHFEKQPMSTINDEQGNIDGFLYQARKKSLEAKGLAVARGPDAAVAELLGAINYLAGAVLFIRRHGHA